MTQTPSFLLAGLVGLALVNGGCPGITQCDCPSNSNLQITVADSMGSPLSNVQGTIDGVRVNCPMTTPDGGVPDFDPNFQCDTEYGIITVLQLNGNVPPSVPVSLTTTDGTLSFSMNARLTVTSTCCGEVGTATVTLVP